MTRMWQHPKKRFDWVSLSSTFIIYLLDEVSSDQHTYHTSPQSQSRPFCGRISYSGPVLSDPEIGLLDSSFSDASIRWMRGRILAIGKLARTTQIGCFRGGRGGISTWQTGTGVPLDSILDLQGLFLLKTLLWGPTRSQIRYFWQRWCWPT